MMIHYRDLSDQRVVCISDCEINYYFNILVLLCTLVYDFSCRLLRVLSY